MWLYFLFSRYVKDASGNILPVLDFVSGEAITLHVYVETLNSECHAWNPNDGDDPNADATDYIYTYVRDVKLAAAKQSME